MMMTAKQGGSITGQGRAERQETTMAVSQAVVRNAEENPLRIWRKAHGGMLMRDAAALLRVSLQTVTMWESGAFNPGEDNMARLVTLTGDATLPEKWKRWYDGAG